MHDPERRNKAINRLLKKVKKDGKTPVVTVGQEDP
jgi:hypothetical protein